MAAVVTAPAANMELRHELYGMEEAINMHHQQYGETLELVEMFRNLLLKCNSAAMRCLERSQTDMARELLEKAERLIEEVGTKLNADARETQQKLQATTFNNLSCYYSHEGDWDEALRYCTRAYSIEKNNPEATHTDLATSSLNMCAILSRVGKHTSAVKHAEAAVERLSQGIQSMDATVAMAKLPHFSHQGFAQQDHVVDADNPYPLLAIAYHNLATELAHCGNRRASKDAIRKALTLANKHLGPHHPTTSAISAAYGSHSVGTRRRSSAGQMVLVKSKGQTLQSNGQTPPPPKLPPLKVSAKHPLRAPQPPAANPRQLHTRPPRGPVPGVSGGLYVPGVSRATSAPSKPESLQNPMPPHNPPYPSGPHRPPPAYAFPGQQFGSTHPTYMHELAPPAAFGGPFPGYPPQPPPQPRKAYGSPLSLPMQPEYAPQIPQMVHSPSPPTDPDPPLFQDTLYPATFSPSSKEVAPLTFHQPHGYPPPPPEQMPAFAAQHMPMQAADPMPVPAAQHTPIQQPPSMPSPESPARPPTQPSPMQEAGGLPYSYPSGHYPLEPRVGSTGASGAALSPRSNKSPGAAGLAVHIAPSNPAMPHMPEHSTSPSSKTKSPKDSPVFKQQLGAMSESAASVNRSALQPFGSWDAPPDSPMHLPRAQPATSPLAASPRSVASKTSPKSSPTLVVNAGGLAPSAPASPKQKMMTPKAWKLAQAPKSASFTNAPFFRVWTQVLRSEHEVREHHACVIQRAWRCALARLELHNRRQLLYHHVYQVQTQAACMIQHATRRYLAVLLVGRERACQKIQAVLRGWGGRRQLAQDRVNARFQDALNRVRANMAARAVQHWYIKTRPKTKEEKLKLGRLRRERREIRTRNAIIIERVYRGHMARQRVRAMAAQKFMQERRQAREAQGKAP
uniref:Uncharacterized protein n=1 Tax=Eutreptiella gymnastica TaxID=73025 RepID=A0A7S4GGL3_9EUGL